jgi:hypothetical protein
VDQRKGALQKLRKLTFKLDQLMRAGQPGIAIGLHDGLTSSIDLVPTIVAYSGYSIPRQMRGRDLLAPSPVSAQQIISAEADRSGAISSGCSG